MHTHHHKFVAVSFFVMAAILFTLVAHSLPARLLMLPTNSLRLNILDNIPVKRSALKVFIDERTKALQWHVASETYDDLAMAYALLAHDKRMVADGDNPYLVEALSNQAASLSRMPLNSYGWAEYSYLLIQNGDSNKRAAQALELSLILAPYEPRLAVSRVAALIHLWNDLDQNVKDLAPTLIRDAWKLDHRGVVLAAQSEHGLALVSDILSSNQEDMKVFNDLLEQAMH